MNRSFLYIIISIILTQTGFAQLAAHAGASGFIGCLNGSLTIGSTPSATGGSPPYQYLWQPGTFLNSTTVANPVASNITSDITYTLTVTDRDTNVAISTTFINLDKIFVFSAGVDTGFCYGQTGGTHIGASNNNNSFHNFNWSPASGLDNPTSTNPLASPSVTTIYTLTVSDSNCPNNVSTVKVSSYTPPYVNAGADTIIDEGQTITLHGTGGLTFWWQPEYNIKYITTDQPDVWPATTTVYSLFSVDQHGCYAGDDITVTVISGDKLFFYSAFTPNGDGDNDVFYIGNLGKYPDNNLRIYNRYGKEIYSATNYDNSWGGTYLGNLVPTGTYFYIFNDGKDALYKGTVTILR